MIQHSVQMKKYNGIEFPISTLISIIDAKKGRRRETSNLSKIAKDYILKFLKGLIKIRFFQQN